MNSEELKKEVDKVKWFHRIDLGNGFITPGEDDSPKKLRVIGMPTNLQEKTVLDIGAWDGFFSFEAERRGAVRVLATDWYSWGHGGWGSKSGFELARNILKSKVVDKEIDVLDLSPERVGVFDLVLFLGVLYHLRHPLLALEKISSVTKGQLILETVVDLIDLNRPAIAFYPGQELDNDASNWWGPNSLAVIAMLKTVGFREVKIFSSWLNNRMVFHAWK